MPVQSRNLVAQPAYEKCHWLKNAQNQLKEFQSSDSAWVVGIAHASPNSKGHGKKSNNEGSRQVKESDNDADWS